VFKHNLAEQLKEIPSREPNSDVRMIFSSDHGATRADKSVQAPQSDPNKLGTRYARGNRMEKADGVTSSLTIAWLKSTDCYTGGVLVCETPNDFFDAAPRW